jgi:phage-related protein
MNYEVEILPSAKEYIDGLSHKMQAKIVRAVELLKNFGYQLHEPHAKTLKNADGLKELRVKLATDICRIFYFHYRGRIYVATSGYTKKADETDRNEIERALRIKNAFLRENL